MIGRGNIVGLLRDDPDSTRFQKIYGRKSAICSKRQGVVEQSDSDTAEHPEGAGEVTVTSGDGKFVIAGVLHVPFIERNAPLTELTGYRPQRQRL